MQGKSSNGRCALVTGGAGLIGSHLADLLIHEGWHVRILDNLEPQTHRNGLPPWISPRAQFVRGDIRDRAAIAAALEGIDVVFHQAAYGGYMPEITKFVSVNSFGTAQLLEVIRDENLPVKKVVVASSQVVYTEGAVLCSRHGLVYPTTRALDRLNVGDWNVYCPLCGEVTRPTATSEDAPIGADMTYAITKVDQEHLTLSWSKQTGIPAVALRYACTYGPRQSIFNPYTGIIAIFATRVLNGLPPLLFEDGEQIRDLCFVEDVAHANLLVAMTDKLDGLPVNVGTGMPCTIRAVAETVIDAVGAATGVDLPGEFRTGEMRSLYADISRLRSIGYEPSVDLQEGVGRYLNWIKGQGEIRDYFAAATQTLREKRMVHKTAPAAFPVVGR